MLDSNGFWILIKIILELCALHKSTSSQKRATKVAEDDCYQPFFVCDVIDFVV